MDHGILTLMIAAEPGQADPEDPLARFIAVLGVVLSALALLRLWIEGRRKRAANVPSDLHEIVKLMLNDLSGALQRPERVLQLNTPVSGANIERLEELGRRVPDWLLARRLKKFHTAVGSARVTGSSAELTLTHDQLEKVQVAISSAKKVLKRLDRLSKIAPG